MYASIDPAGRRLPTRTARQVALALRELSPSVAEVTELIELALDGIPERQGWINPDCGLKTRGYDETVASLENILEATRAVRARVGAVV